MSVENKNKIFFSLIRYVLSEQNNVEWLFKTSLIKLDGLSTKLKQEKYVKYTSTSSDLLDYVKDIKPYHVQFEKFVESHNLMENINIIGEDIFKTKIYSRFDNVQSTPDNELFLTNQYIPLKKWINTTLANRLFYKIKDLSRIFDLTNSNFKGKEISGGKFVINKQGFDSFLYSEMGFDYPTLSYHYHIIDYNQEEYINSLNSSKADNFSFDFIIEDNAKTTFDIENISLYTIEVKKTIFKSNNYISLNDFKKTDTGIKFYNTFNNYETLYVNCIKNNKIEKSYIYFFHPYVNTTNHIFINYDRNNMTLQLPHIENYNYMLFYKYETNENSKPFTNYQLNEADNEVTIFSADITKNSNICLKYIDYTIIFDKIYNWDDRYGYSNNAVNLNGSSYLRYLNEKDRPDELMTVNTNDNVTFKLEKKSGNRSIMNINYQNNLEYISKIKFSKLLQELNIGDSEIVIEPLEYIQKPTIKNITSATYHNIPGRIMIGSEIIEYYKLEQQEDRYILSSIRRGTNGTSILDIYPVNTSVYAYTNEQSEENIQENGIIHQIEFNDEYILPLPLSYIDFPAEIDVKVKKSYSLYDNIYTYSNKIFISSPNIINENNFNKHHKGFIIIDNSIVLFNNYSILDDMTILSDFEIHNKPEESNNILFDKSFSKVYSSKYENVTDFELRKCLNHKIQISTSKDYDLSYAFINIGSSQKMINSFEKTDTSYIIKGQFKSLPYEDISVDVFMYDKLGNIYKCNQLYTIKATTNKNISLFVTPNQCIDNVTEQVISRFDNSEFNSIYLKNQTTKNDIYYIYNTGIFHEPIVDDDSEEIIITDFDYLVIRYQWSDGQDLDTETYITNLTDISSVNNLAIGWKTSSSQSQGNSVPRNQSVEDSVLYWADDNTDVGEENILISINNLKKIIEELPENIKNNLPNIIDIQLEATWFSVATTTPINIEINAYKGGTMTQSNYMFHNNGGTLVKIKDSYGNESTSQQITVSNLSPTNHEYVVVGHVYYNRKTNSATIVNVK